MRMSQVGWRGEYKWIKKVNIWLSIMCREIRSNAQAKKVLFLSCKLSLRVYRHSPSLLHTFSIIALWLCGSFLSIHKYNVFNIVVILFRACVLFISTPESFCELQNYFQKGEMRMMMIKMMTHNATIHSVIVIWIVCCVVRARVCVFEAGAVTLTIIVNDDHGKGSSLSTWLSCNKGCFLTPNYLWRKYMICCASIWCDAMEWILFSVKVPPCVNECAFMLRFSSQWTFCVWLGVVMVVWYVVGNFVKRQ